MLKVFLLTPIIFTTFYVHSISLEQTFYKESKKTVAESDIGEHLSDLAILSSQCESVCELGTRSMVSTVGILYGLSQNNKKKQYFGFDLDTPPVNVLKQIKNLANSKKIEFHFTQGDDRYLDIPQVDMIFIDTLHTYKQLSYELEKFHSKANKFIALHDTSEPWGDQDEPVYFQNNFIYPQWIDSSKQGLWAAVQDFLDRHPEWDLQLRKFNCHGFTVLKRK